MTDTKGNVFMKFLMLLFVSLGVLAHAATPQVKNVKAMQQYPWGKVYITYEVVGSISSSGGTCLQVVARDKNSGQTYAMTDTLQTSSYLSGDTGVNAGQHKIVWDIAAQGVSINSANTLFAVEYLTPLYLIVDLSSGSNAVSYPVAYVSSPPSGGFNVDAYKTTKLVLKRIEAGTFKMQNTSNVTLTKPFYCGLFEVTQRQYELVTGLNPCTWGENTYPVYLSYYMIRGSSNGARWPSSSAVDSTSFMGKLRARTGLDFDLPTEAQWEYVCRAGTTTAFSHGNYANGNYMWYTYNSIESHAVGMKSPNPWGLYDMHGSLWEWCLDRYGTLAYGTDPKGSSSGLNRVIRGGSWDSDASHCTSSYRDYHDPYSGPTYYGFRLVRTLSN